MVRNAPVPPSHLAPPLLAGLVALGLVGRAEALAAFLIASGAAATSQSGRTARLPRPSEPGTGQARCTARGQAAQAVRAVLASALRAPCTRTQLRTTALRAAGAALSPGEVDALLADAIATHLRHARSTGSRPPASAAPSRRTSERPPA
jgi:hypothetical protein